MPPPVPGVRRELPQQSQPGETHPPASLRAGVSLQILPGHVLQLTWTYETHQQVSSVGEQAGDSPPDARAPGLLKTVP